MQHTDRRRIIFAAVLTTLALPALWVANADRGADPAVGAAGIPAPVDDSARADEPAATYQPEGPVFLDQPTLPAPATPLAVQAPATAAAPAGTEVIATATFKRIADPGGCATNLVIAGTTLTVVNIDNGRTVTCRAVVGVAVPVGTEVVLDTNLMAQITDLSEAPIPVRVSW
jgi:hypothetical protein